MTIHLVSLLGTSRVFFLAMVVAMAVGGCDEPAKSSDNSDAGADSASVASDKHDAADPSAGSFIVKQWKSRRAHTTNAALRIAHRKRNAFTGFRHGDTLFGLGQQRRHTFEVRGTRFCTTVS